MIGRRGFIGSLLAGIVTLAHRSHNANAPADHASFHEATTIDFTLQAECAIRRGDPLGVGYDGRVRPNACLERAIGVAHHDARPGASVLVHAYGPLDHLNTRA